MANDNRGIGVIGAGPAGLAAAWRLRSAGRSVTVYEARGSVGGRLRTEELSGTAADVAVQLLSAGYDRTRELAERLGAGGLLVRVPGRDALWRGGRIHQVRYGSVTAMAASGALPTGLKLKLGLRYVPFLERNAAALDLNEPARAVEAGLDEESIADWGHRELGSDFVELLAYPLLASLYGATPEETSAGFFHALARTGMGVDVLGVSGGVGALAESLAAGLRSHGVEILLERSVEAVDAGGSGVRLEGRELSVEHDAVVIAVPAADASRLVPPAALPPVQSRSTAALVVAVAGSQSTGWFGLSLPRSELRGTPLAAVCVQEEKGTGVALPGRGSLVLVPAPDRAESWAAAEPRSVAEEAVPVLERLLPGTRERIVEARLVRLPAGGFVPYPGYLRHLARYDGSGLPPGVALAGDYLVAPTVEGAVRSGYRAADRISRLRPGG